MSTRVLLFREATPEALEASINKALAKMKATRIGSPSFSVGYDRRLLAAFTYNPDGVITAPFKVRIISEVDDVSTIAKMDAFIARRPSDFFSPVFILLNGASALAVFYNEAGEFARNNWGDAPVKPTLTFSASGYIPPTARYVEYTGPGNDILTLAKTDVMTSTNVEHIIKNMGAGPVFIQVSMGELMDSSYAPFVLLPQQGVLFTSNGKGGWRAIKY